MNFSNALYLRGKLVIYNMLNMGTIFTNIQSSMVFNNKFAISYDNTH